MFDASLADDKELFDLIDQAEKEAPPVFHGNQYQSGVVDNVNNTTRPDGNTRQHALRKLRKDRPVQLCRVRRAIQPGQINIKVEMGKFFPFPLPRKGTDQLSTCVNLAKTVLC